MHPRVQAERLAQAQGKAGKATETIAKTLGLDAPAFAEIRGPNEGIIRLRQMEVMADFLELVAKQMTQTATENEPRKPAKGKTTDEKN
jgi:hypothetical protein